MEIEMKHFAHKHLLILKAEERKIGDGTDHTDMEIRACYGCLKPISGPFYECGECSYFLHKVCAELPNEMNHPMHPQHQLTLLSTPLYSSGAFQCNICGGTGKRFVYNCSICSFDVDLICASASHKIEDKCHQHPLIPLQRLISFPCDICRTEMKGLSYKCNICPFWVHQNCTILLPSTIQRSDHHHLLTLVQSVPPEYERYCTNCDICHDPLFLFQCVYYCAGCMFFAHVSCARSKEAPQSPSSRDQNIEINQNVQSDGQHLAVLPVQQQSTDLISWFAENYRDRDPITNLILGFAESYIDPNTDIKEEIAFFDHKHPLFLIDGQVSEKLCDACVQPISTPSYGCIECDYFLHKCCTELPKQILHPAHPQHQISLWTNKWFLSCKLCRQLCNGLVYRCLQCRFLIDIKCASLLRPVKYEAYRQPLIPRFTSSGNCSACRRQFSYCNLKCKTFSFNLCFCCAVAPPIMKHRFDKHPFKLTYSPPEDHYNEYYCDLCERVLNPKLWFYHCSLCDQFAHIFCMIKSGADSNIKYGKSYKLKHHKHKLTVVPCTFSNFFCKKCGLQMKTGCSIGLECVPCDFRIHLYCNV